MKFLQSLNFKGLVVAIFFALPAFSFAQHFVITHNGDSIPGPHLVYDTPIMQNATFIINNQRFISNNVKYIRNNNGTFANLNHIHGEDTERYALRIKTGRACAFEEVNFGIYSADTLKVYPGMKHLNRVLASGKNLDYYCIGKGTVYQANYSNMKRDFASNPESLYYINHYHKMQQLQVGLVVVGVGILTYEFIHQQKVSFTPVAALGTIISLSPLMARVPKREDLWQAFAEFNKAKQEPF